MGGLMLTVKETATFLRVSARTVYRLIESGQLEAVRIGSQWRIPSSGLPGFDSTAAEAA